MIETTRTRAYHLWRWAAGYPELDTPPPPRLTADELAITEGSPEFERLMRRRLIVGAYRYGRLHARDKPRYDRCTAIQRRIAQYTESGNVDLLVDVANLALLEFEEGRHPLRHLAAEAHRDTVSTLGR